MCIRQVRGAQKDSEQVALPLFRVPLQKTDPYGPLFEGRPDSGNRSSEPDFHRGAVGFQPQLEAPEDVAVKDLLMFFHGHLF